MYRTTVTYWATTDDLEFCTRIVAAPFDGDLNDYYKWLTEQQKGKRSSDTPSTGLLKRLKATVLLRKEQNVKEAEFRVNRANP